MRNSVGRGDVGKSNHRMREAHPPELRRDPMRKFIVSATIALVAAVSFAAPSQAGYYSYGHKPHCFIKKVKSYDYYGNVIIKKIKVCK
jgi:hypothetical protein